MTTLHRAMLALLLGASAMLSLCASAGALPPDPDAGPGQRVDADSRPLQESRYRVAQYGGDGDDDGGGGNDDGGGADDGGGGNDNDSGDDDYQPQQRRPSGPSGGGFNFRIPNIIIPNTRMHDRRQSSPPRVHDRRQSRPAPPPRVHSRKDSRPAPKPKVHSKKDSRPVPPPKVHDTRQSRPAPVIPVIPPPVAPVVDAICSPAGCADNFPQVRIGATTLSPYRTNRPADRNSCAGMTAQGCYLRVMNSAPTCGGQPTCVMHCPPTVPVVVPQCLPNPQPVLTCANPPCGPEPDTKDPEEPPTKTTKAIEVVHNVPVVNPTCAYPPCGPGQQDPEEPPTKTPKAIEVVHNVPVVNPACANPPCGPGQQKPEEHEPPTKTPKAIEVVHNVPAMTPACANPPCGPGQQDPEEPPTKTTKAIEVVHNIPVVTPACANPPCGPGQQKPEETHEEPTKTPKANQVVHLVPVVNPVCTNPPCGPQPEKKDTDELPVKTPKAHKAAFDIAPWPKNKPRTEPAEPPSNFGFDDATPVCTPQGAPPVGKLHLDPQIARTLTIGAVAAIPKVGAPLSALTKLLWPDRTNDALFDQMRDYVDKLVPEKLAGEFAKHLEHRVVGIRNNIDDYQRETDPIEKARDLNYVVNAIRTFEPDFFDETHPPDRTLQHFVAFGALRLAALKEQLDHADEKARDGLRDKLAAETRRYLQHAQKLKDQMVQRRVDKVHTNDGVTFEFGYDMGDFMGPGMKHVTDEKPWSEVKDDACGWTGQRHDGRDSPVTRQDLGRRKDAVRKAYGESVDGVLEPLTAWRALLPEEIERREREAREAAARREREAQEADRWRRQMEYEAIERESCRGINC